MEKMLMILEVSRKQEYIFSSQKLRENAARSAEINYVTGNAFFEFAASDLYAKEKNMVYSGGGHTVLQFETKEQAIAFAKRVSGEAIKRFRNMELFIKLIPYDEKKTPKENLESLTKELERKKSLRRSGFRRISFGVEALDPITFQPQCIDRDEVGDRSNFYEQASPLKLSTLMDAPAGWEYPKEFSELGDSEDNFIAVVHIDGNGMGARVQKVYESEKAKKWNDCCEMLRNFSEGIQKDFEEAFQETVETVISQGIEGKKLPIRPVILAGDDVCFVTAGRIGLECARIFLEKLSAKRNCEQQELSYAACAGVALVHTKYPFYRAYDLAEALCSNAKKFGVEINEEGRISAMDWHIEFGQLKESLSEIRKDYETEDGNRMELRPITVVIPEECQKDAEKVTEGIRTYDFFRRMSIGIKKESGKVARSKIKDLRVAFKQGEVESSFFLQEKQIYDLLYHGFNAKYGMEEERMEAYRKLLLGEKRMEKEAFLSIGKRKRCLYFDAIETMDHCIFFGEVEE